MRGINHRLNTKYAGNVSQKRLIWEKRIRAFSLNTRYHLLILWDVRDLNFQTTD